LICAACFGGCDWNDDADEEDAELPPDADDIPPLPPDPAQTRMWDATVTGLGDFAGLRGDAFVRQTEGASFSATVTLRGDEPGSIRPWHVHVGTCATGGGIVGDPAAYDVLAVDAAGVATAMARVGVELEAGAPYHVNVHFSPADLPTIIACGDLVLQ
jgi:hypothetical protein